MAVEEKCAEKVAGMAQLMLADKETGVLKGWEI
jgi:hypothetical protein